MGRDLLARKPVLRFTYQFSGSTVAHVSGAVDTTNWTELIASLGQPASAIEIFNGGGNILEISNGAVGAEVANAIPYYIIPGGSAILLPIEFGRTSRLAVRSIGATSNVGNLVLNFFA